VQHSRTKYLEEQFRRLTLKPGAPSDVYAIKQWKEIAERCLEMWGEERMSKAVAKWAEVEQFFPSSPRDLESHLPALNAAPLRCAVCRDYEGWERIVKPNGSVMVRRCKHPGVAA